MELTVDEEGKFLPLLGKGFHQPTQSWQACLVYSFDEADGKFDCQWKDFDSSYPRSKLSPLNVFFVGDSETLFARRLKSAIERRQNAEALIRFHFYVGSMPTDRLPAMDETFPADGIVRKGLSGIKDLPENGLGDLEKTAETLVTEVRGLFFESENEVLFMRQQAEPDTENLLEGFQLPEKNVVAVPERGTKSIPAHDFRGHFWAFCHNTLYILPETFRATAHAKKLCMQLLHREVYDFHGTHALSLQDWTKSQETKVKENTRFAKDVWMPELREGILRMVEQKGEKPDYFNINETDINRYQEGRLKKLLVQVGLMVADNIRSLVMGNTEELSKHLKSRVPHNVVVKSLTDISNQFLMKDFMERLKNEQQAGETIAQDQLKPFFVIVLEVVDPKVAENTGEDLSRRGSRDLSRRPSKQNSRRNSKMTAAEVLEKATRALNSTTANKRIMKRRPSKSVDVEKKPAFRWKTPVHDIEKAVAGVYTKGVEAFDGIPSLPSAILPHILKFAPQSVGFDMSENWVQKRKDIVQECVSCHREPWMEEVDTFINGFSDIVSLDPVEKIKEYMEMDPPPPAAQVTAELKQLSARMREVEAAFPITPITVGMFQLDLRAARSKLLSMLEAIKQAVLGFVAGRLESTLQVATDAFTGIFQELDRHVSTVEELNELREYMSSEIPSSIGKLQQDVDENVELCELVESFSYRLSDEIRDKRWKMFAAPGNVGKTCEKVSNAWRLGRKPKEVETRSFRQH
jgi:hypothetical protein